MAGSDTTRSNIYAKMNNPAVTKAREGGLSKDESDYIRSGDSHNFILLAFYIKEQRKKVCLLQTHYQGFRQLVIDNVLRPLHLGHHT